jgi:hypothetical protein
MHTVIETTAYLRAARDGGLSESERDAIVTMIANDPVAGDEIVGTGGCRKVRVAGRGKGKSGGYRLITFFSGADVPVYLLTVFSKGQRSDLTAAERNRLAKFVRTLVVSHRRA